MARARAMTEAYQRLTCARCLEVVPGATHLLQEPGALERVAELAVGWLEAHVSLRAEAS